MNCAAVLQMSHVAPGARAMAQPLGFSQLRRYRRATTSHRVKSRR